MSLHLATSRRRTKVVLCEDSLTYTEALKVALDAHSGVQLTATYSSAEELIKNLDRIDADIVLMDLELPGMNGIEAVSEILKQKTVPIVLLSAYLGVHSERVAQGLSAGAIDAFAKSSIDLRDVDSPSVKLFIKRLKALSELKIDTSSFKSQQVSNGLKLTKGKHKQGTVIGIGASTGGPSALRTLISALPKDFEVPIIVVQHMSDGFLEGLVLLLNRSSKLEVKMAKDGQKLGPGVWVAPEGAHLIVDSRKRLKVQQGDLGTQHTPSVDILFESMANSLGSDAIGVVLTGMGEDGAHGVALINAVGGVTVAQNAETSVVYGMPRAAAARGAKKDLSLEDIPKFLTEGS